HGFGDSRRFRAGTVARQPKAHTLHEIGVHAATPFLVTCALSSRHENRAPITPPPWTRRAGRALPPVPAGRLLRVGCGDADRAGRAPTSWPGLAGAASRSAAARL